MKRFAFFVLSFMFLGCGIAQATAISDVVNYVDWAGMIITGDSSGLAWEQYHYASVHSYAENNFTPQTENKIRVWDGSDVFMSNIITNASSSGYTTPLIIGSEAHAIADGILTTSAGSSVSTEHNGAFTVAQSGILTFTLPYSIEQHVQIGSPAEGGSVSSYMRIGLFTDQGVLLDGDEITRLLNVDGDYINDPLTDNLSVSYNLAAGQNYTLYVQSHSASGANAPKAQTVPEPSTMLLLGSGLLGLVGLSRKVKK